MRVGFTGARKGMTPLQETAFHLALIELKPLIFRHGCCVGADEQAHAYVYSHLPGCLIIGHPPVRTQWRMPLVEARRVIYAEPRNYLERNRIIVVGSVYSSRVQRRPEEPKNKRGGTWYTYRYASEQGKPRILILPDGTVRRD